MESFCYCLAEKTSKEDGVESDSDHSSKFDFGPPLLFSGDSIDIDNLPDKVQERLETITIRRQHVGKLGKYYILKNKTI